MILLLELLNLLPFTLEEVAGVRFGGFFDCSFFSGFFPFGFGATVFFFLAVALGGLFAVATDGVTGSELLSLSPSDKFTVSETKSGYLAATPTRSLILEDLL